MKSVWSPSNKGIVMIFANQFNWVYSPLHNRDFYLHQYCQIVEYKTDKELHTYECVVTDSEYRFDPNDKLIIHVTELEWYCTSCTKRIPCSDSYDKPKCSDCEELNVQNG